MELTRLAQGAPAFTRTEDVVVLDEESYVYVVNCTPENVYFIAMCEETGEIVDNVASWHEIEPFWREE